MSHDELEAKVNEFRNQNKKFFKPWFKMKVRDTLKPQNEALITLIDANQEMFDDI